MVSERGEKRGRLEVRETRSEDEEEGVCERMGRRPKEKACGMGGDLPEGDRRQREEREGFSLGKVGK